MEKLRAKRIMCLILVAILILATAPFAFAYPSYKNIGVPNQSQENDKWCWAACSVSALGYNGISETQSGFVVTVKGSTVYEGATLGEIKTGLEEYGASCTLVWSNLSYSDMIYQMNTVEQPAIAGWNNPINVAHAVEICGYNIDPDTNYVLVMDPAFGYVRQVTYWLFENVCFGTIYNIH